jgi:hypothetical protein
VCQTVVVDLEEKALRFKAAAAVVVVEQAAEEVCEHAYKISIAKIEKKRKYERRSSLAPPYLPASLLLLLLLLLLHLACFAFPYFYFYLL